KQIAQRLGRPIESRGAQWLSLHPCHGCQSFQRSGDSLFFAGLLAQGQALLVASHCSFVSALIQGYAPHDCERMSDSALIPQTLSYGQTLFTQLRRSPGVSPRERDNGQIGEPARNTAKIAHFA